MNAAELQSLTRKIQRHVGANDDGEWGEESATRVAVALRIDLASSPAAEPPAEPEWLRIARREIGTAEIAGARDNPRIVAYHQTTTLEATDDEVPWCASFAGWCLAQAGMPHTHSARARSYLEYGTHAGTPQPGDVVVFRRGSSPTQGHVAFYLGREGDRVRVLGGNQGNRVSIASFPASSVIDIRRP